MVNRRKAVLSRQLARVERCTRSLQTAHLVQLIQFDLVVLGYLSAICVANNCWVIGSAVGWLLVLLCATLDWLVTCLSLGSS